ncbi:MAG: DUF2189 domain-containing protein [Acetobacteraceae bacterium]
MTAAAQAGGTIMATRIRSPLEWAWDELKAAGGAVGAAANKGKDHDAVPGVRRIGFADLGVALARGFADFQAVRSDVAFLCCVYPVAGLVLARIAFGQNALALIFPLVAGFALVGPVFGVGLNEISRRREMGRKVSWVDAFGVVRAHAFGRIVVFALLLAAIFVAWLVVAGLLYDTTLGPQLPATVRVFVNELFATSAGRVLILAGIGIGFLFAVFVLAISVVTVPMLLDRDARLETAIATSMEALAVNPVTILTWGLIIALGLVIGAIPLLIGLVITFPVLGHATWHLYRRVVA